jgi:hypothetical protein
MTAKIDSALALLEGVMNELTETKKQFVKGSGQAK